MLNLGRLYSGVVLSSGVIGANVFLYEGYTHQSGIKGYFESAIIGMISGLAVGAFSPVLFPAVVLGAPGYLLAKHHSSQLK
jgi:hypothetical protein